MEQADDANSLTAPSARAIAEAAPIGIFRADPAGRITYINPALERISGVSSQRALGASWLRSAPAELREHAEQQWQAAIAAGENWETEFRFKHTDGSMRYASILTTAEHDDAGKVFAFTGFVTDVTSQRADQAQLKRSERLFRLLAENATDIIVRLDLDDHVTYASPAMGEVTGFSAEETTGINPISSMHPDDSNAAKESSRQLKAGEIEQAVIEYRTPHKDGRWIWVEARSRLVRNRRGDPQEVISVVRDISEHKRLQEELTVAREAENEASAAQGRFLATMSHEIRTPISGVIGMIDLLVTATDDDQVPRYRTALAASARTLLRVVDDVLDYSRLSSAGITLEKAPFDVFAMVHNVIDLYRPAAAAKGVTLGLSFRALDRQATGDATRLSQILGNLVSNAIKFTHHGRVDVDVGQKRDHWTFQVSDTGIGISADQLKTLFVAFAQADATIASRFGGTGLGLTIAKLIAEAMGGSMTVSSEPGSGSKFGFDVWLDGVGQTLLDERSSTEVPNKINSVDILVADDNEVNLLYLSSVLEQLGHRVVAVRDGVAAVDAARTKDFDAIFLDRHMPRLDGEEAAQAIRALAHHRHSLIVMVSAATTGRGSDRDAATSAFDASLPKPIRRATLEHILARHRAQGEHPTAPRRSLPDDAIAQALGDDAAQRLRKLFMLDLEDRIQAIERAIEKVDHHALRFEAHAIAGAADLMGETSIAEAARRVEHAQPETMLDAAEALRRRCMNYLRVNSTGMGSTAHREPQPPHTLV